jgi:hypothetical protein
MRRPSRIVLAVTAAVAVVLVGTVGLFLLRGDAARPDRAEIVAALKRDPRTADVPDAAARCVADWYLAHASREQIDALIEGDTADGTAADAAMSAAAKAAILECLKTAT